ncbi:MAG: hypothetical protein QOE92_105, partial [Chloroflexota bacterium]|nr:hypothetical protein [Chloroflexota bacterium]
MSPAPWVPTHTVPAGGLETFLYGAPAAPLDPGLPVQAAEWADGWARIVCENGWEAWVDGARLLPVAAAPAASAPVAPALAAPAPATPASYPAAAPPPITAAPVGPAPYPAQAAPLAYATPAPRRRRPRRLLFLGVGALVLLIAFGGVFGASRLLAGGNRPAVADNLFADPTAAAGQLTAGLDKPMPVPRQDVRGLFETYPPVPPGNVLPPPLDEDGPPRSS